MMSVLILIFTMSVSPADCAPETARTVLIGPDATNEISCAMQSQAYFGSTALTIGADEYLKIVCTRKDPSQ